VERKVIPKVVKEIITIIMVIRKTIMENQILSNFFITNVLDILSSTSSSYNDDDDNNYGYSKPSNYIKFVKKISKKFLLFISFPRNGNFNNNYKSKKYTNDYSSLKNNYDDSYNNDYRKKRQYGLNVDQDRSLSSINKQRVLPQQFQVAYKPIQSLSYGSTNQQQQQQARLVPTTSFQQQMQFPTQLMNQPLAQRMLFLFEKILFQ
jgi:hypothetical protein